MLTIFADPLRFAMATIHHGVDYANSNGLASLDGAGSKWPANGPPAGQAVLPSQFAVSLGGMRWLATQTLVRRNLSVASKRAMA